ncbi:10378_t:CDS:2, partial [Gigaspora margarita]
MHDLAEMPFLSFPNLISSDTIITEPTEIKEKIKEHFTLWTKPNPTNNHHWETWKEEYAPRSDIQAD